MFFLSSSQWYGSLSLAIRFLCGGRLLNHGRSGSTVSTFEAFKGWPFSMLRSSSINNITRLNAAPDFQCRQLFCHFVENLFASHARLPDDTVPKCLKSGGTLSALLPPNAGLILTRGLFCAFKNDRLRSMGSNNESNKLPGYLAS